MSKPAKPIPTYISRRLDYNPDSGLLTWKGDYGKNRSGDTAGVMHSSGYVRVCGYLAHRIAWAITFGDPGSAYLDHRNGVRSDNRIDNLRLTDRAGNAANRRCHSNNTSGHTGVTWNSRLEKWTATIHVRTRKIHLGSFATIEAAGAAYRKGAELHYGEFAAHRRAS